MCNLRLRNRTPPCLRCTSVKEEGGEAIEMEEEGLLRAAEQEVEAEAEVEMTAKLLQHPIPS